MTPALRAIHGRENAHNYFMQTWAELGLIGLLAFSGGWARSAPDGSACAVKGERPGVRRRVDAASTCSPA
jgi:hypothetical protein